MRLFVLGATGRTGVELLESRAWPATPCDCVCPITGKDWSTRSGAHGRQGQHLRRGRGRGRPRRSRCRNLRARAPCRPGDPRHELDEGLRGEHHPGPEGGPCSKVPGGLVRAPVPGRRSRRRPLSLRDRPSRTRPADDGGAGSAKLAGVDDCAASAPDPHSGAWIPREGGRPARALVSPFDDVLAKCGCLPARRCGGDAVRTQDRRAQPNLKRVVPSERLGADSFRRRGCARERGSNWQRARNEGPVTAGLSTSAQAGCPRSGRPCQTAPV